MQDFTNFLNAVLWPAIVGGGLIYFRHSIKAAFPRLNKFGPLGFDTQLLPQPIAPPATTGTSIITEIRSVISPELLQETRALVEAQMPMDRHWLGEAVN